MSAAGTPRRLSRSQKDTLVIAYAISALQTIALDRGDLGAFARRILKEIDEKGLLEIKVST
jgi:hypothetical protein